MAANSFLLKAWSVTLVAALFALAAKDTRKTYFLIAFLPALAFWLLDAYYLHQEKLYRDMYEDVRKKTERQVDFSLKTDIYKKFGNSWFRCFFTKTLAIFYGVMVLVVLIIIVRVKTHA